ncbi:VRR-NUC domain-containing protein [Fibrella aestuarina]|uniref:VRR-NUC domain-containing protein n=1 Tax=Fibrella aestuarina TaxID=651143 RepID=UPI0002D4C647|nr:VRR-NUC domain-containing protein [Fibrella aestuarina]
MTDRETQFQIVCVRWFRELAYRPFARLLYHVPNGGKRTKAEAGIFKAMGVQPGTPDLHLALARCGYHSLYIELKAKGNDLDPEQFTQIELLQAQGHLVRVIWDDLDAFIALVTAYINNAPLDQIVYPQPPGRSAGALLSLARSQRKRRRF